MAYDRPDPPEMPSPVRLGSARQGVSRLRILATSDLHAHITPWDYHKNRPSPAIGLARTASLIAKARAEVAGSILVDNGDFLQGSPLGDVQALRARGDGAALHPMIAAMNQLGYDVATLGNHEFSHGLDFLMTHLATAQFPVISANLVRRLGPAPLEDQILVPPTLIVTRELADASGELHPLRVGFIGLAPPQTIVWDHAQLGDRLQARDILEAAAAHVPALRAQGADVVIALSHSGIGSPTPAPAMENASAALATLAGIDALVTGHTHQTFPAAYGSSEPEIDAASGYLSGKPAVMPGFYGSHLGVIDLDLIWADDRWQIRDGQSALRPIARRTAQGTLRALTQSAPEIMELSAQAHQATQLWARRRVGQSSTPLHSYFAMIAPTAAVRLVAQAQAAQVARSLAGGPYADLPLLSAAAPFQAGGRGGPENYAQVAAGRLTLRNVFDLYPYPNTAAALVVSAANLHDWLERSFSQFQRIAPGSQDSPLLNADFPSFNFDTIEGLTWAVDLSAPARFDTRGQVVDAKAQRIIDLRYQGNPLDPGQRYVLATNSYRASGSGAFAGARPQAMILDGPQSSRDILADHIASLGRIGAAAPANWRFVAMPGTSVLFDSAPKAADHLADLAPLQAEPLGLTPQGFRRFRLHL